MVRAARQQVGTVREASNQMDTKENAVHVTCLPESPYCRGLVQETIELISNKWAVPLILTLCVKSPLRYGDLRNAMDGISTKELAKQLRLLEASGLIGRQVHPSIPPRVEYWITDLGKSLRPLLEELAKWASIHGLEVSNSRKKLESAPVTEETAGVLVHRIR